MFSKHVNEKCQLILTLVVILCLASVSWAKIQQDDLAEKRYADPNGYFRVMPPAEWTIQEYPNDIRGKVAFMAPDPNIEFRILVNAVDFDTMHELLESCRRPETRLGVSMNIEKFDFYGRQAVRRSFKLGGHRFLYVDFLIGKLAHNLAYSSPLGKYDLHLSTVRKSMATYEPILKELDDTVSVDHLVARKLRLGRLMLEIARVDLALDYVREGLALAPENKELLKLKQEVGSRFKKHEEQDTDTVRKRFESKKFGISFDVPEKVNVYTKDDPGPMSSRINSATPLWLVNSSFPSERINLKVSDYQDATESELNQFKQDLDKGTLYHSISQYQKISVRFIKIGKNEDKHTIEHIHALKQKVPKILRQVMFVHRGRLFSFTCSTSPERFDNAGKQFFDLIFQTMEYN